MYNILNAQKLISRIHGGENPLKILEEVQKGLKITPDKSKPSEDKPHRLFGFGKTSSSTGVNINEELFPFKGFKKFKNFRGGK